MIKNFLKILILVITLFIIFIAYFSYFGISTTKFNTTIKNQIKKQNNNLDIDLKKVKLHLDLKNISIKIKTENPKIILNKSKKIELKEVSTNILISSYLQNKFALKNISIKSKKNKLSTYIEFYRLFGNPMNAILIKQFLKNGSGQINADLYFDNSGNIKNNFNLSGEVSNVDLKIDKNKIINELNFDFRIYKKNYTFEKIFFKFNEIKFISENINIEQKKNKFNVKGSLKSKENKINKDIISQIFNSNLENLNFSNSKFKSSSEFTFDISKKFKLKNLKIDTILDIDELILDNKLYNLKNYIENYNNFIKLKANKFQIKYSKKKILVDGSSEFYVEENLKNLLTFKVEKNKNKTNFETFFEFKNIDFKIDDISYNKKKNDKAFLQLKGFIKKDKILLENINYIENNNKIEINNLEFKDNKILNLSKINLSYLTNNNFKNQITLEKENYNYQLIGKSFDAIKFIENISKSDSTNSFFDVFKNLNSVIKIDVNKVKLDNFNIVSNLNGKLEVKNNKIFNLNLNSNFSKNEKIFISVKTQNDNSVLTTFHSDRAKPFVKKYKFIKGFEGGNLDFTSTKINNTSKSKLIIDNFKVKEIPVLAKILTLASLQGIADLLTGEGVRFTDFEMIYTNKGSLMTIDEIYAIGPAVSIMMEGYVESGKLVSLKGTLVPATTINRTISSIPLLGDLLVGKKVGEGVFGVSFKIKGPPKDLKTRVNPIKTLTPRFITRTLEKIKKN